jgi:hypothetical protein
MRVCVVLAVRGDPSRRVDDVGRWPVPGLRCEHMARPILGLDRKEAPRRLAAEMPPRAGREKRAQLPCGQGDLRAPAHSG